MANNATGSISRLGRIVKERREELGMSQRQMLERGGPSNSTLTSLENGKARTVSNATLRKLDMALRWTQGSAKSVLLHGEDPIADESRPAEPSVTTRHISTERVLDVRNDELPQIKRIPDVELLDEIKSRLLSSDETRSWLMQQVQSSGARVEQLEDEIAHLRAQLEEQEQDHA